MTHGRPDKLVLSFHGLPQRSLTLGDPYHCECLKTGAAARRAAEAARGERRRHLPEPLRQGRVAEALHRADAGRAGERRASPGSTSSAPASRPTASRRSRRSTRRRAPRSSRAGGKEFGYIPCLNDQHEWHRRAGGDRDPPPAGLADAPAADADAELRALEARALAAGAAADAASARPSCDGPQEPRQQQHRDDDDQQHQRPRPLQEDASSVPSPIDSALRICASASGPRIMPTTTGAVGKSKRRMTHAEQADGVQQDQVERRLAHAVDADGREDQDAGVELRLRDLQQLDPHADQRQVEHQQHHVADVERGDQRPDQRRVGVEQLRPGLDAVVLERAEQDRGGVRGRDAERQQRDQRRRDRRVVGRLRARPRLRSRRWCRTPPCAWRASSRWRS